MYNRYVKDCNIGMEEDAIQYTIGRLQYRYKTRNRSSVINS